MMFILWQNVSNKCLYGNRADLDSLRGRNMVSGGSVIKYMSNDAVSDAQCTAAKRTPVYDPRTTSPGSNNTKEFAQKPVS